MAEGDQSLQAKGELISRLLYDQNALPHPPYNAQDGRFHAEQMTPYIENHIVRNYLGGLVIYGDTVLTQATELMDTQMLQPYQLPELVEVEKFTTLPARTAVCIAEMRDGSGDIFEGISLALALAHRGLNVNLVLPRDEITYKKTEAILETMTAELDRIGLPVFDYNQAYNTDKPFDLAVYPSTQRYAAGTLPANVSILLRESGETHASAGLSWQIRDWGGVTVHLNSGYNIKLDKYGAVPPICATINCGNLKLTPREAELVDKIEGMKNTGKEVVIAYPGSSQDTEAIKFLQLYRDLLKKGWNLSGGRQIIAIIPGDILNLSPLSTKDFYILQTGRVRNAFLSHLCDKHISLALPSLVAGSMSMAEAMYYGIPFFYKTELWKKGNADILSQLIQQADYSPLIAEGGRGWGTLKGSGLDPEGSPINILYWQEGKIPDRLEVLSGLLKNTSSITFQKIPKAILGWYGFLNKLQGISNPTRLKSKLESIKERKLALADLF